MQKNQQEGGRRPTSVRGRPERARRRVPEADWKSDTGEDDYNSIYKMDMTDEWINAAYDEHGNAVLCDICGAEMKWSWKRWEWYCPDCGQTMNRAVYFNHIGAEPPGLDCLTNCRENYPFCKKTCERYILDPDDPMLTS